MKNHIATRVRHEEKKTTRQVLAGTVCAFSVALGVGMSLGTALTARGVSIDKIGVLSLVVSFGGLFLGFFIAGRKDS